VKSQGHSISFHLVFAAVLGAAAFFVACSGAVAVAVQRRRVMLSVRPRRALVLVALWASVSVAMI
jgi:hypothetical protein